MRHLAIALVGLCLALSHNHQAPPHPRGQCIAVAVVNGHVVCTARSTAHCTNGVCVG